MIGGLIMAGQLIPKLNFPLQIDYAHATRYAGGVHGGKLTWLKKPDKSRFQEKLTEAMKSAKTSSKES